VERHHPVERKIIVEGVSSAGLQIAQTYRDNLYCSRSSLERRRVQSPSDEKGHNTYST
jgi:hypothetical protein